MPFFTFSTRKCTIRRARNIRQNRTTTWSRWLAEISYRAHRNFPPKSGLTWKTPHICRSPDKILRLRQVWLVFHVSPHLGGKVQSARYEISANQRDHVLVRFCRMPRVRRIVHFRVENVKKRHEKLSNSSFRDLAEKLTFSHRPWNPKKIRPVCGKKN